MSNKNFFVGNHNDNDFLDMINPNNKNIYSKYNHNNNENNNNNNNNDNSNSEDNEMDLIREFRNYHKKTDHNNNNDNNNINNTNFKNNNDKGNSNNNNGEKSKNFNKFAFIDTTNEDDDSNKPVDTHKTSFVFDMPPVKYTSNNNSQPITELTSPSQEKDNNQTFIATPRKLNFDNSTNVVTDQSKNQETRNDNDFILVPMKKKKLNNSTRVQGFATEVVFRGVKFINTRTMLQKVMSMVSSGMGVTNPSIKIGWDQLLPFHLIPLIISETVLLKI